MKILLIVPTFKYKETYPAFLSNSDFPVGFAYIAGALRRAGHDVYGLNPNNDTSYQSAAEMVEAKIRDAIARFRPDVVGLGGLCTDYAFLCDAIGIIRRVDPAVRVVCGGGIVTHDAAFIFPDLKPDFCVIGEGEEVIVELLREIEQGHNYERIPNLGYWFAGNPRFTRVDYSMYGELDDRAFPDYALFGIDNRLDRWSWATRLAYRFPNPRPRVMTLVTARGCPFRCSFCVHHHGPRYRIRSIPNILKEIDELYERYQFNILIILDEMFSAHKSRMREFCQSLIAARNERGWNFHWTFQTHANAALDQEMLTLAKVAGCAFFSYGLESASPRVLKSMNKRIKLESIVEAIALSESTGLVFGGNLIFGDPEEDFTTARESLDFFWKYCTRMHSFIGQIHPYPGSLIFQQCMDRGLISDKKDFYVHIDERVWNMTRLPNRVWYPWICLMFYFASKMPWLRTCDAVFAEPDAESEKYDTQLQDGMVFYNVTAACPHCGHKTIFREALPGGAPHGAIKHHRWFGKIFRIFSVPSGLMRFRLKAAAASVLYLLTSFRHPIFGLLRPFMIRPAGVSFVNACPSCGRLMRVVVPQLCKMPARPGFADRVAIPMLKSLFPVIPPLPERKFDEEAS